MGGFKSLWNISTAPQKNLSCTQCIASHSQIYTCLDHKIVQHLETFVSGDLAPARCKLAKWRAKRCNIMRYQSHTTVPSTRLGPTLIRLAARRRLAQFCVIGGYESTFRTVWTRKWKRTLCFFFWCPASHASSVSRSEGVWPSTWQSLKRLRLPRSDQRCKSQERRCRRCQRLADFQTACVRLSPFASRFVIFSFLPFVFGNSTAMLVASEMGPEICSQQSIVLKL